MSTKTKLQDVPIITLFDQVIEKTKKEQLSEKSIESVMPQLEEIGSRLSITPRQVLILTAILNHFDDHSIDVSDLARHFDVSSVKILTCWDDILGLKEQKLIRTIENRDGSVEFSLPYNVLVAIRANKPIESVNHKNLTAEAWFDHLSELLQSCCDEKISVDDLYPEIVVLKKENKHLKLVQELNKLNGIDQEEELLLLTFIDLFVQNGDNRVMQHDLTDIFERKRFRYVYNALRRGNHTLQEEGLVEHCNSDGQVETDTWMLTRKAKELFLSEIEYTESVTVPVGLRKADSLTAKKLFFNSSVTKQIRQLEDILQKEKFTRVQENLQKHGMRRGFACIFYGAPGTGKTESVLQLARKTGRDLMMVDVPNLRSKWVGDTEKNIKAVFEHYRNAFKSSNVAPILLFNEADAVLCKRNEGATTGVDKMENAMQNIILQEMEDLEGIMIATTNLTNNLDPAFERRFLYKIEFPKPTPAESRHIWHSMLPDLSEDSTIELAKRYDFSGGQIENIARKQIVNSILSGEYTVSLDSIREACDNERFTTSKTRQIGFC